jgi:hypothetical protein
MANIRQIRGRQFDVREMLLKGGVGQYNAQLAIPYMFFLPRTADPYAQGVMLIVEGLQRLLNKRGARLKVDGGMGQATVAELVKYSGSRWHDKNFIQLYGDVMQGDRWAGFERRRRAEHEHAIAGWEQDLGSSDIMDVVPVALLAAGAAVVWWKFFR